MPVNFALCRPAGRNPARLVAPLGEGDQGPVALGEGRRQQCSGFTRDSPLDTDGGPDLLATPFPPAQEAHCALPASLTGR